MSINSSIITAIALLSLGFSSMAYGGGRRDNPDLVEDALAFALTDRTKSLMLLEGAIDDEQSSESNSLLSLFAGEQRRLSGDIDIAHRWFAKVLELSEQNEDISAARLGLALLELQKNPNTNSLTLLRAIPEDSALDTQNADRYLVLAVEAHASNNKKSFSQYSKKSLAFAKSDPAVLERVRHTLTPEKKSTPVAETPQQATATKPSILPTPNHTPMERAELALEVGDAELAAQLAEQILATSTDSDEQLAANYLIKRSQSSIDPTKIAVLLPFTEKYEAVGAQFRQALEYGYLGDEEPTRKLVFIDSGSTEESITAALEAAALEHGAIAAIGPLLSEQTETAIRTSNALRLPLISLSQSLDDTTDHDWAFQAMVNTSIQVEALLDYVSDELGMTTFGIFAPDTPYGHRAATVFTEAAEEREAIVTNTHFYDPVATDLIPFAKEFGRKDYEERAVEYQNLRKIAKENGRDPSRVVLPPTLDFEAIFIPDNVSRIPLACAALAYEEFPMGEFQTSKEGPIIPLLGLSGWNHPAMVARGGPYARGSYFTDVYQPPVPHLVASLTKSIPLEEPEKVVDPELPMSQEDRVDKFVANYREVTGRTPKSLEVVTVDAGRIVATAAASEAKTRAEFRQALLDVVLDTSLTGATGFDKESRIAHRTLEVLTITKDGILSARMVDAAKTETP